MRHQGRACGAGHFACRAPSRSPAQDWPQQPIRIVVGFGAGGGTDIAARIVAQPLSELLGQPVVVENRVGGGGTTAAEAVARAPEGWLHRADDEQRACGLGGDVQDAALRPDRRLPDGVDGRNRGPRAGDGADFPAKDLKDVIAHAKANPGKLNFGSPGRRHHPAFRRRVHEAARRPRHPARPLSVDAGRAHRADRGRGAAGRSS